MKIKGSEMSSCSSVFIVGKLDVVSQQARLHESAMLLNKYQMLWCATNILPQISKREHITGNSLQALEAHGIAPSTSLT